jgi:hypothetical protein
MLRHLVPLVLAAALGSGSTCSSETSSTQPGTQPDTSHTTPAPAAGADEARCVDTWLEQNHLDQYGNKTGTLYAGGTPLFDEMSGKTTDRLAYIYQNHPEAKAACHK